MSNQIELKTSGKNRISKKLLKALPERVADALVSITDRHDDIKSFTYSTKPQGWKYIVGEGEQITVVYGEEVRSVDVVSANTLGGSGMSHAILAELPAPAGTLIMVVGYMSGYWLHIYNITEVALPNG